MNGEFLKKLDILAFIDILWESLMRIRIKDLTEGVHRQHLQEQACSLGFPEEQYHFTQPLRVQFALQRAGQQIVCRARLETSLELECSRCLELTEVKIAEELTLLIAFSAASVSGCADPDVKFVPYGAEEVDVSEEIRQIVLLAIPGKPLCIDDCLGLCPCCGQNLNQKRCRCQGKAADPRWSDLQKLLSDKIKGEASGRSEEEDL
jgi:uncharacterized protein